MNQTVILGALELGGIFAILSLGLYISYKVLNLPDLTVMEVSLWDVLLAGCLRLIQCHM